MSILDGIFSLGRDINKVKENEEVTEMNWVFSLLNANVLKSDEQVGQEVRASVTALGYLNSGFQKLAEFTVKLPEKPKKHPAL